MAELTASFIVLGKCMPKVLCYIDFEFAVVFYLNMYAWPKQEPVGGECGGDEELRCSCLLVCLSLAYPFFARYTDQELGTG